MNDAAEASLPLDPVLSFMRLLAELAHELESTSAAMSVRIGVTAQQRTIIRIVGRFPGVSAGRLAELLCVDPATVSIALSRLERRGLIRRERDPRDRRRVTLALTAQGRGLDVPAEGTVESAVAAVLARAHPEDAAKFASILTALAGELRGQREGTRAPVEPATTR